MHSELISALIALVFTGIIGGIIKVYYDYKSKQMENIWNKRLDAYIQFTKLTALFAKYPPKKVTWHEVHHLSIQFRDWYFEGNGLVASTDFRDKYFKLHEHLIKLINEKNDSKEELQQPEYDDLREQCSKLRTLMASELQSHENPVWYRLKKPQQV